MENKFFSINKADCINSKNCFEKIYDSKEISNIWHRAVIVYKVSGKGWIKVSIKAFDKIEELNQMNQLDSYFNPVDINLYKYRGRYLKLKLEYSAQNLQFNYMRIYYLANTFVRYLPEVYQDTQYYSDNSNENSINEPFNIYSTFFFRFMAMFQNIYLDMEESISKITELMDPIKASKENLDIIAKWLNAVEFSLFSEDTKREFLIECMSLYQKLGTRYALIKILNLITGQTVGIIENDLIQNLHKSLKYKNIRRIFKEYEFRFIVLLVNRDIDENQKRKTLSIINYFKPAHTDAKVIYLAESLCLNGNTYLGVNSRISAKTYSFDYTFALEIGSILTEKKCNILNYTYLGINSFLAPAWIKYGIHEKSVIINNKE